MTELLKNTGRLFYLFNSRQKKRQKLLHMFSLLSVINVIYIFPMNTKIEMVKKQSKFWSKYPEPSTNTGVIGLFRLLETDSGIDSPQT